MTAPLVEGVDYIENGLFVFTARYLLEPADIAASQAAAIARTGSRARRLSPTRSRATHCGESVLFAVGCRLSAIRSRLSAVGYQPNSHCCHSERSEAIAERSRRTPIATERPRGTALRSSLSAISQTITGVILSEPRRHPNAVEGPLYLTEFFAAIVVLRLRAARPAKPSGRTSPGGHCAQDDSGAAHELSSLSHGMKFFRLDLI